MNTENDNRTAACIRCGERLKGVMALIATLCGLCADDDLNERALIGFCDLLACDGYCVETNPEILKLWPDEGCDKFAVTWRGGKNLCAKCDKKIKAVMEWGNYITG